VCVCVCVCVYIYIYIYIYIYLFFGGATLWPPHSWGFYITRNDAPQLVGLLWTSDQLFAETST